MKKLVLLLIWLIIGLGLVTSWTPQGDVDGLDYYAIKEFTTINATEGIYINGVPVATGTINVNKTYVDSQDEYYNSSLANDTIYKYFNKRSGDFVYGPMVFSGNGIYLNLGGNNLYGVGNFSAENIDANEIGNGTVADARIASTIARDSEILNKPDNNSDAVFKNIDLTTTNLTLGDLWSDPVDSDIIPDGNATRDLGAYDGNKFAIINTQYLSVGGGSSTGTGGIFAYQDTAHGIYFPGDKVSIRGNLEGDDNISTTGDINIKKNYGQLLLDKGTNGIKGHLQQTLANSVSLFNNMFMQSNGTYRTDNTTLPSSGITLSQGGFYFITQVAGSNIFGPVAKAVIDIAGSYTTSTGNVTANYFKGNGSLLTDVGDVDKAYVDSQDQAVNDSTRAYTDTEITGLSATYLRNSSDAVFHTLYATEFNLSTDINGTDAIFGNLYATTTNFTPDVNDTDLDLGNVIIDNLTVSNPPAQCSAGYAMIQTDMNTSTCSAFVRPTGEDMVGNYSFDTTLFTIDDTGNLVKYKGNEIATLANVEKNNTIIVAIEGGEYTSIQSAIDSITDASTNNRYNVEVKAGKYTEDIIMKDYVYVSGSGTGTEINGQVTFNSDNLAKLQQIKVKKTNDIPIIFNGTGKYYIDSVSVINMWMSNSDAYKSVFQILEGDITISYTSIVSLQLNHDSSYDQQTIYHLSGDKESHLKSFSCTHAMSTYDTDDDISIVMSENTNSSSLVEIKNGYISFGFEGTNHGNDVVPFYSLSSTHDFRVSLNQIDINVPGTTTTNFDYFGAFIYNTPNGESCTILSNHNDVYWEGSGVSDDDINLGVAHEASGGESVISIDSDIFNMVSNNFPEVGGGSVSSNGDVYYTLYNGFGDIKKTGTLVPIVISQSTDYGATSAYDFDIMLMNASDADKTITFPTPVNMANFKVGQTITIYNVGTTEHLVFIDPNGNEVDGSTDNLAIRPNGYITFMKVNGDIRIVNKYLASQYATSTDFANLELHIDFSNASSVGVTGFNIDNVTDLSSKGYVGESLLTNDPDYIIAGQNGLNYAEWNSPNSPLDFGDIVLHNNTAGRGLHIFLVVKPTAGGDAMISKYYDATPQRAWDFQTSRSTIYENANASGNEATANSASSYNDWQILDLSWSPGSGSKLYNNGFLKISSLNTVTDIPVSTASVLLGARDLSSNDYYGDMAEVIVYSDVLSDADRLTLVGSLGAKWDIDVASPSVDVEVYWERDNTNGILTPSNTGDSIELDGNVNMSNNNVTYVDCILFDSGGKICSGS